MKTKTSFTFVVLFSIVFPSLLLGAKVPSFDELFAFCSGVTSPAVRTWLDQAPAHDSGWNTVASEVIEVYERRSHELGFVALPQGGEIQRRQLLEALFRSELRPEVGLKLAEQVLRLELEDGMRERAEGYLKTSGTTERYLEHAAEVVGDSRRPLRERIQTARSAFHLGGQATVLDWVEGDPALLESWENTPEGHVPMSAADCAFYLGLTK